jgi:DNA polymerase I-like protein with 3'-5' exonuclease and polymerase domains
MLEMQALIDEADIIAAHNAKHDVTILRNYLISFDDVELWCTMLTEYLLSGMNTTDRTFGLSAVAEEYGMSPKLDKVRTYWDDDKDTCQIPVEILHEYVLDDCRKALTICEHQIELVKMMKMDKLVKLQNEFTLSLSDMELYGFKFDTVRAKEIVDEYGLLLSGWEKELQEIADEPRLKIASNQQLSALLYGGKTKVSWTDWVIQTLKTKPESKYYEKTFTEEIVLDGIGFKPIGKKRLDGSGATDKETIKKLKAKTPVQKHVKKLLLEYSNAKKVVSTLWSSNPKKGLLNKLGIDGHIHPNLNQTVTATGRLSSSDPNSQNMPRGSTSPIKECIIPAFDGIMEIDLSQIEWRVAAELSCDTVMLHEINSGIDQHSATCIDLMERELTKDNRTDAKIFNFRMIYGGSPYGFYMDSKMPNFAHKKWKTIYNGFYEKYYDLERWQDENIFEVMKNGELTVLTGRRFIFHKTLRKEGLDVYNERQIKNYPVQGVAGGDILPLLSVIIRRGLVNSGLTSRLILTVHDSIIIDYVDAERERLIKLCGFVVNNLREYIQRYFGVEWVSKVEGEIELGPNWGTMKEIDI